MTDAPPRTAIVTGGGRGIGAAIAARLVPVGRAGRPEDIARLVSFPVGDRAGFVSGQVIDAAGGPRS